MSGCGLAAQTRRQWHHRFVIPAGHMIPLSAETGGCLDAAFSMFLKEVVTSGLDFGESPVPVWTKGRVLSLHHACALRM